jgi:hypothetical protein
VADSLLELLEITTAIDQMDVKNEFKVYPNPSHGFVTLTSASAIHSVQVFAITGQLIKESNLNANSVSLNCSGLNDGTYILKVNNSMHQRIVLN